MNVLGDEFCHKIVQLLLIHSNMCVIVASTLIICTLTSIVCSSKYDTWLALLYFSYFLMNKNNNFCYCTSWFLCFITVLYPSEICFDGYPSSLLLQLFLSLQLQFSFSPPKAKAKNTKKKRKTAFLICLEHKVQY